VVGFSIGCELSVRVAKKGLTGDLFADAAEEIGTGILTLRSQSSRRRAACSCLLTTTMGNGSMVSTNCQLLYEFTVCSFERRGEDSNEIPGS
jgi:hypothetical protein